MAFQGFLRVTPPVVTRPTAEASSGSDAYLGPADGLRSRPIGHDNIPSPTGHLAMRKLGGQIGWAYIVVTSRERSHRTTLHPEVRFINRMRQHIDETTPAELRNAKVDRLVDTQAVGDGSLRGPVRNSVFR